MLAKSLVGFEVFLIMVTFLLQRYCIRVDEIQFHLPPYILNKWVRIANNGGVTRVRINNLQQGSSVSVAALICYASP